MHNWRTKKKAIEKHSPKQIIQQHAVFTFFIKGQYTNSILFGNLPTRCLDFKLGIQALIIWVMFTKSLNMSQEICRNQELHENHISHKQYAKSTWNSILFTKLISSEFQQHVNSTWTAHCSMYKFTNRIHKVSKLSD